VEDGASESCPENANKEDYDHLSLGGHKIATHKRDGENDVSMAQLTDFKNWTERVSRSRRTDSSDDGDDDSNVGVLLFK
jgi:hypothetical protein